MATQTIVDALDRLTNVLKGEDEGGSGGGVKLGNMATVRVWDYMPTDIQDYNSNRDTHEQNVIYTLTVQDMKACRISGNTLDVAEGITCKIKAPVYFDLPIQSGPVDACIIEFTEYVDGVFNGTLTPYPNVMFDAEKETITLPISDIPDPLIIDEHSEYPPLIIVHAKCSGLM